MTELTLISVADGPDVEAQDSLEQGSFESLMADEVVMEWLESLEREESAAVAAG
ncbi:MAG: hypothetical protein ACOCSR_00010 [Wenzhouxiangella sp.]